MQWVCSSYCDASPMSCTTKTGTAVRCYTKIGHIDMSTMLNIKKENRWEEPSGVITKKPKAPAEWWPLFEAISALDEGEIISLAVVSDEEARLARYGLQQWNRVEAFNRNAPSTVGYKSRLFRLPGGGMKLKFRRVHPDAMRGSKMRGLTRGQYRQGNAARNVLPPLPRPDSGKEGNSCQQ